MEIYRLIVAHSGTSRRYPRQSMIHRIRRPIVIQIAHENRIFQAIEKTVIVQGIQIVDILNIVIYSDRIGEREIAKYLT